MITGTGRQRGRRLADLTHAFLVVCPSFTFFPSPELIEVPTRLKVLIAVTEILVAITTVHYIP